MAAKTIVEYEKLLKRLAEIVELLEAGDVPLEKGLALYKEGAALVASCRERLDKARNEVEILSQGVFSAFGSGAQDADGPDDGEDA